MFGDGAGNGDGLGENRLKIKYKLWDYFKS